MELECLYCGAKRTVTYRAPNYDACTHCEYLDEHPQYDTRRKCAVCGDFIAHDSKENVCDRRTCVDAHDLQMFKTIFATL